MKVMVSYPPLESDKGTATLGQNRQFQWFSNPSFIYPMIPASAATLLAQRGYQVIWNDGIAEGWTYPQFLEFFERERPDVIALETKTPVVKQHWGIIDGLKAIYPETQVVLMGDHVTALPEESMRNCPVDFVITGGDYDFSLLSICEHLSRGEALETGIWFREGEQIRNTGPFQLNHDLNSLPLLDRGLTKWHLYGEHLFKKPCTYTMVGRDCWYHQCTFCSWPTLYPGFRVRSPESLLDEVGLILERYPVKEIFDDTGTFPVGRWLEEFCRGMIKRGYAEEVYFSCNMRVAALNFDEYVLMRKAGFRVLKFGLESASQQTLDRLNKGTTVEQITESCKQAKKAGLEPHLTSMVGYPWESKEDACHTLDLARKLFHEGYADTIQATVVMPYPGSPLFAEAEANGWLKYDHDWEKYDMTRPVLVSPIDDREIMELVNSLYGSFMSPKFIMRKLLSIRSWDDAKYLSNAGKVAVQHILDFKRGGQAISHQVRGEGAGVTGQRRAKVGEFIIVKGKIASDIWVNCRLKEIEQHIEDSNKWVLDLGSGEGTYIGDAFASKGNRVIYADIDFEQLMKVDKAARVCLDALALPFRQSTLDVLICADVLEHIENDQLALENIYDCLKANGIAIVTLPAHKSLYSKHQLKLGHLRRYDLLPTCTRLECMGFRVKRARHSCWLLFLPFVLIQRLFDETRFYKSRSAKVVVSQWEVRLRGLLNWLCKVDCLIRMPFGLSLVCILEKPSRGLPTGGELLS